METSLHIGTSSHHLKALDHQTQGFEVNKHFHSQKTKEVKNFKKKFRSLLTILKKNKNKQKNYEKFPQKF